VYLYKDAEMEARWLFGENAKNCKKSNSILRIKIIARSFFMPGNEIGSSSALVYLDTEAKSGVELASAANRCFVHCFVKNKHVGEWLEDASLRVSERR
jgi:hypothetical protein